jgi:DNA-binding NtrC family response regulator
VSRELILLVEDDPQVRLSLGRYLRLHEFELSEAATCAAAEESFRGRRPDLVLTDYQLPDGNSLDLLQRLRRLDRTVPVVFLTGHGSIDLAVRAIKEGAEQFLTKPVDLAALLAVVERLVEARRARQQRMLLQDREARDAPDPFIGTSDRIRSLREEAMRLAEADGPVLLAGETGTGKGVLTAWLHRNGARSEQALVDLNCAGLSRELLESELFGYEKGAFTSAVAAKPGLLEVANRGTLFLDEIGDVDLTVQPRLLKVLEEQKFRRLGDVKDRKVDLRLIAATHHDLERAVREKRFRGDLFYRLSVLPLRLPALRERPEDIPALARRLLSPGVALAGSADKALAAYPWPGNVRELRNVLERAQVVSRKKILEAGDLHLSEHEPTADEDKLTLADVERRHIERVLRSEKGKVARAAEVLGIAKSSLYEKLRRFAIDAGTEPEA